MELGAGAVHVWRVDLDAVPSEIERLLDSAERERAARILSETVRRRRIRARAVLRMLLGMYLGETPESLRLNSQRRGKPVLDLPSDSGARERLHFNVSHSGALALYALTELCPIGIDVELLARRANARRLGPEELRTWVRYEAEAKRTGVGIAIGNARSNEAASWIVELDVGPDAIAAIALESEPSEVVYLDWSVQAPLLERVRSGAVLERQLSGDLAEAGSGAVAL